MRCVLVTGATGFIGRHCLEPLLAHGFEVNAVTSKSLPQSSDCAWHQADLLEPRRNATLMADLRPSHLLHLAWYAVPGAYWTSPENLQWVAASLHLVRAFAENGGRRLVVAGTCAEYDWRYGYCSEAVTPIAPATLYGTCKHALHLALSAFAAQAGLSLAWARLFWLYGPHEHPKRLVPSVALPLLRGEPALCSHGDQVRDYLHVQDCADALACLLSSDVSGSVNVASGQPVALRDVIAAVARAAGRPDLVRLGAIPASAGEPPLVVADVRRLALEVGWSPRHNLAGGIAQTVAWWREQG